VNSKLLELIPDYVLGLLPEDEMQALDDLCSRSADFCGEVDRVADSLAFNTQTMAPAAASVTAAARARLLRSVGGIDRFAPFFEDLTRLFQLPLATIRGHLARIDDDSRPWERSLLGRALHRSELFHFAVGPQLAAGGAAGGVLRLDAGQRFPVHRHQGNEVTYVLEGGYVADGRVYGPGSQIEMPGDTSHDYEAAPERDLVIMVLHRGISFD
jgi:hypothetical protein